MAKAELTKNIIKYMSVDMKSSRKLQPEPEPEPELEPEPEPDADPDPNPERESCWSMVVKHRDHKDAYTNSSFRNAGYWSQERDDIPMTFLSNVSRGKKNGEDHNVALDATRMEDLKKNAMRWKADAKYSVDARAAAVTSTVWFWVGFFLLIVNWAWLQLFVLLYMEHATTPAKISIGVLVFNGSQAILGGAVKFVMKSAEVKRK